MKKRIYLILIMSISMTAWAQQGQYTIQSGDSLTQILREKNYGQTYKELLPFINEVIETNPQAFKSNNPDLIIPDTTINLPDNPNEQESIPEPQPMPVVEPVPEPIPEVEPKPEAIGHMNVFKGISEVLHEAETFSVTQQQSLYVGDIVFTQENTRAEIILIDDSRITLGSNSHVVVNEFSFMAQPTQPGFAADSLITTIHKGVMRMVTGLIGKNKKNRFEIKSAFTSTIGVRGTDFMVRTCIEKQKCGDLFGVSAAVRDGAISLKNKASEIDLNKNEFAQVKSSTEVPKKAPLPEGFFDIDRDVADIAVKYSWWEEAIDWLRSFFVSESRPLSGI